MKTTSKALIALLALGASALIVTAQDDGNPPPGDQRPPRREGPGGPGMNGPRPPVPPLMAALDANHDGVIDETEIANASAALKKLDKNGDGKLTQEELRPPRPQGGNGPDGQRGPGGPRGPRGPQPPDGERPPPPQQ